GENEQCHRTGVPFREMLFLQLFSALIFFSQGQGVVPYSLQNCVVHGKWSKTIKVLCYHQNLSQVPSDLPWNVILNVSQNQIHLIAEGTFTHTSSLKILNLTSNQLRVLSSSMFDGLGNLTVLLLRKNNIDRIEPSAFLRSLNALDVVFKVKSLEELHIRENNITHFTTKDNVPMWLRELDASHNPISFIDVATDALYRLLSLDLSFSELYFLVWNFPQNENSDFQPALILMTLLDWALTSYSGISKWIVRDSLLLQEDTL
uniref:Uncharacterized protein n=1 Tax=Chrysemys picta bellii TaxID=8478 RepID=A0A8C3FLI3_CHRPI